MPYSGGLRAQPAAREPSRSFFPVGAAQDLAVDWLNLVDFKALSSALVGSLIAFAGVWMTNRSAQKRQDAQLAHDSRHKERDRKLALKRDLYLEAVAALHAAQLAITQLADMQLDMAAVQATYVAKSPAIMKVIAVAEVATLRPLMEIAMTIVGSQGQVLLKRRGLMSRAALIKVDEEAWKEELERHKALVERMNAYNLDGQQDQKRWEAVKVASDASLARMHDLQAKLNGLRREQEHESIDLVRHSASLAQKVMLMWPSLIGAIRHELHLEFDQALFDELFRDAQARQHVIISRVISEVQAAKS